jgi:hypothetical protein
MNGSVADEERSFSAGLAITLGLMVVVGTNLVEPMLHFRYQTSPIARTQFPIALLFFVLIVSFFLNPLLGLFCSRARVRRDEVAAALAIGFVGAEVPSLVGGLVATISAPHYFASAENQWPTFVLPYLKDWLAPSDENFAVTWFYQGLPAGLSAPIQDWVVPLFWWVSFVAVIFLACVALGVIFRRQWVEHERLAFPFAEVPLGIVREAQGGRLLRNRLFWVGFAITFTLVMWNVVGYFAPSLPRINVMFGYPSIATARDFPPIYTKLDFYIIGFAYFTPLNILLSLWLARLLLILQSGISRRLGLGAGSLDQDIDWQNFGGLLVFVLWGLWMARHHLRQVFRTGLRWERSADDERGLLSYRTAVWIVIFAFLYLTGWLMRTGMDLVVALLFLGVSFVLYMGMAKIIAMAGLVAVKAPTEAGDMVASFLGTTRFDAPTRLSLNMMMAVNDVYKGFTMPAAATAARLGEEVPRSQHTIGKAIILGGLIALLVGIAWNIHMGYQDGAQNYEYWSFNVANTDPYNNTVVQALNPKGTQWAPVRYLFLGALIVAVLSAALYRFSWWPIHPIGFTVASTWTIEVSAFSLFLAWFLKMVVLKVGGIQLYRRSQVLVLGAMAGYSLGIGIGILVDIIFFPGQGTFLHLPPM